RFRTMVTRIRPAARGSWEVSFRERDGRAERTAGYQAVLVATGHHWQPRYPEPAIPGAATFDGEVLHSHQYRTPDRFADRRVLVVGIGNSGADIAAEASRVAARTLLAGRRGVPIVPRRLFGMPADYLTLTRLAASAPAGVRRWLAALAVRVAARGPASPDYPSLTTGSSIFRRR